MTAWQRLNEALAVTHTPCMSNPDMWFDSSNPHAIRAAKAFCEECPLRTTCLEAAMERREPFGVWGGMTALQRRSQRTPGIEPGGIG